METFFARPRMSKTALVMGVLAASCVVIGVLAKEPNWYVGAALPAVMFFMFMPLGSSGTEIILEDEGVQLGDDKFIPYDEIQGMTVGSRIPGLSHEKFPTGQIVICHEIGIETIDGLANGEASRFYEVILTRIPRTGSDRVVNDLGKRLQSDLDTFDHDLVSTFCARKEKYRVDRENLKKASMAMVIAAIIWTVYGSLSEPAWFVGVVIALIAALIVYLISQAQANRIKDVERSSMIISPRGLALHQGPLTGQLNWEEIIEVTCTPQRMAYSAMPHIAIKVEGARITIFDVYDRPLGLIYRQIHEFWNQS